MLIGHEVSGPDVVEALDRIGIRSDPHDDAVVAQVPSFRPDLQAEEDLIEEVARVQGYENLRSRLPTIRQVGGLASAHALRRRVREALVRAGLREALSLSFASTRELELMGDRDAVRVANPPTAEQPFLRRSLLPGLLQALARTISRGARGAALFEVGHAFHPGDPLDEREVVAAVMTGPAEEGPFVEPRTLDFFDGKGALEDLLAGLGVRGWKLGPPADLPWHPARSAVVEVDGERVGAIGELDPRRSEALDLPGRVVAFELDVAPLAAAASGEVSYRDIPRFPPVRRDLAFIIDAGVPAGDVRAALEEAAGELLGSVRLFDVHEGPPVPQGKKSLAFSVDLRAPDRTLTDAEAARVVDAVSTRLAEAFGAELRSG